MSDNHNSFMYKIEWSAVLTVIGVILLFSCSVIVTVILPNHIDPTWVQPSSSYQKQMYEIADPNVYISSEGGQKELHMVYHIKEGYTLSSFQETDTTRIIASPHLEKYVTRYGDHQIKLTSDLLLLHLPQGNGEAKAQEFVKKLQNEWKEKNKDSTASMPGFIVLELFTPPGHEAIALRNADSITENWASGDYVILDENPKQEWHKGSGVIYVLNPIEYRVSQYKFANNSYWRYDPKGAPILTLEELKHHELSFQSRKDMIYHGEHIYAIEGCWYCHTDQTRTLVQDVVLNGSESYPAPPSSANEYIYQVITFPGTRRIGPDLSRVAIKRPGRDWHKGHFWSPTSASKGSIMPSFQHFFDNDPRGSSPNSIGIPNYKFESIYQYLMTKGTRITPPNQAWWLGKDPVKVKEIIEGKRVFPNAVK